MMNELNRIKKTIEKIPRISDAGVDEMAERLPQALAMIGEKHKILHRYCSDQCLEQSLKLALELNQNLGRTLLAVYRFHLNAALVDEYAWFIRVLSSRGFKTGYFKQTLETWIMAIHALISPGPTKELTAPLECLLANLETISATMSPDQPVPDDELKIFLKFLLAKKRRAAVELVLAGVTKDLTAADQCHRLVIPALDMIGILWQENKITAADEHAATEICRYIIFRLYDLMPQTKPLSRKAVVSCVPGENHDLGAVLVANYLENKGWTVHFTGPSAPAADILKAAVDFTADAVFLSVTMVANLIAASELLKTLKTKAPGARSAVGGRAAAVAREILKTMADFVIQNLEEEYPMFLERIDRHA